MTIRRGSSHLFAAFVVESEQPGRVGGPGRRSGNLFDAVPLPEAAFAAEGGEAALGTDTGPGDDDDTLQGRRRGTRHGWQR